MNSIEYMGNLAEICINVCRHFPATKSLVYVALNRIF